MTTLKSFQAEIDSIAHDKHQQQRLEAKQAYEAAEAAKHYGKGGVKKDDARTKGTVKPEEEEGSAEEADIPLQVS